MSDGISISSGLKEDRRCEYNATYQVTYMQGEGTCILADVDTGLAFLVNAVSFRARLNAFFSPKAVSSIEGRLFGGYSVKINFSRVSASANKSVEFDPLKVLVRLTNIDRLTELLGSDDEDVAMSDEELLYDLTEG